MPDYSKGKIYAIRAPGTDDVYIGSTTTPLSVRMAQHRSSFKKGTISCSSKYILEKENSYIELIEEFPCENRQQLDRREGEIIRSTINAVNFCIAGRTQKEYDDNRPQESREQHKLTTKLWREAHPEQHKTSKSKWNAANRDKQRAYDAKPERKAKQAENARKRRAAKKAAEISTPGVEDAKPCRTKSRAEGVEEDVYRTPPDLQT